MVKFVPVRLQFSGFVPNREGGLTVRMVRYYYGGWRHASYPSMVYRFLAYFLGYIRSVGVHFSWCKTGVERFFYSARIYIYRCAGCFCFFRVPPPVLENLVYVGWTFCMHLFLRYGLCGCRSCCRGSCLFNASNPSGQSNHPDP